METKFFTFSQNNSGGSFDHDDQDGIGLAVIIEAQNSDHACDRAERIGLYFNGCADGRDCPCCGDRWHVPYSDGTSEPEIFGEKYAACGDGDEPYIDWGIPSYVHFIGGEFKKIRKVKP